MVPLEATTPMASVTREMFSLVAVADLARNPSTRSLTNACFKVRLLKVAFPASACRRKYPLVLFSSASVNARPFIRELVNVMLAAAIFTNPSKSYPEYVFPAVVSSMYPPELRIPD